jgi:hypothetical protein
MSNPIYHCARISRGGGIMNTPVTSKPRVIVPYRPMSPEISREAAIRRATNEADFTRNTERAAKSLRLASSARTRR